MNYDFEANWNDIILPLLTLPEVKRSIKKGIKDFLKSDERVKDIYDCSKCPASYQTSDGWYTYITDYEERLAEKLLKTGILKIDKNLPKEEDDEDIDSYFDTKLAREYEKYKNEVLKPFVKYHEKTSLRAYQIFGACHWWNPTFSLTLAKIIYPNEKWHVKSGRYHTTVVNDDWSLVFDILYFDENDKTKGGEIAITESSKQ